MFSPLSSTHEMWKERIRNRNMGAHVVPVAATKHMPFRGSLHVSAWLNMLSADAGAAPAPFKNGFVDRQGQERGDEKLPRHPSCAYAGAYWLDRTHVSNVLEGAS
jgi:hypothetical protein